MVDEPNEEDKFKHDHYWTLTGGSENRRNKKRNI